MMDLKLIRILVILLLVPLLDAAGQNSPYIRILEHPQSATVCAGVGGAILEVKAEPVNPGKTLLYFWYVRKKGSTTTTQLDSQTGILTAQEEGEYFCIIYIDGTQDRATSNTATLTFNYPPTFSMVKVDKVCENMEMVAMPSGIASNDLDITNYKWTLNGMEVASGTPVGNEIPPFKQMVTKAVTGQRLELELSNACGMNKRGTNLTVYPKPDAPTVLATNYCQGSKAEPLKTSTDNLVKWYTSETEQEGMRTAPTPDTSQPGMQTWWASQTVRFDDNSSCEGERGRVDVVITPYSEKPVTEEKVEICVNADPITLSATGENVVWYNDKQENIGTAGPEIRTLFSGVQRYFVTQTQSGKCASPLLPIVVNVMPNAENALIGFAPVNTVCPGTTTVIRATTFQNNPTFRWYEDANKTKLLFEGSAFTTPVLNKSTQFYATLQYAGRCESSVAKSIFISVSDGLAPVIKEPSTIIVSTNDGECYSDQITYEPIIAADNCTPYDQLKIYADPEKPTRVESEGALVTWYVEDAVGNKERAYQTIILRDNQAPHGHCPEDMEIEINPEDEDAYIEYNLDYKDNCGKFTRTLLSGFESGERFPVGVTVVSHEFADSTGNRDTCTFKINVKYPQRSLDASLRVSSYEVCRGNSVTIDPIVTGGTMQYTYSWEPFPWTRASLIDFPDSTTRYVVTIDDGVDQVKKAVTIKVLETTPVALAYDGRVDEIFEGDEVRIDATPGFDNYKFIINDEVKQEIGRADKVTFIAEMGYYAIRVFATNENKCVSSDQIVLNIESKRLPNVFTPNYDNKNDVFLKGFDLTVMTRNGQTIYQGTDGWDGKHRGKLVPDGTYLYTVKRRMNDGQFRIFKETVTLKR